MYAVPNQRTNSLLLLKSHSQHLRSRALGRFRREIILAFVCFTSFAIIALRAFSIQEHTYNGGIPAGKSVFRSQQSGLEPTLSSDSNSQGSQDGTPFINKSEETQSYWASMEKLFIFGDSWTDTHFDPTRDQPSDEEPIGNYDRSQSGFTERARWPVHLTTKYNDSTLHTYNMAEAGSCVDKNLCGGDTCDLFEQLEQRFIPAYVDYDMGTTEWDPDTSLFIVFIGINDVWRQASSDELIQQDAEERIGDIARRYADFLDQLYNNGARHFLLMNTPPAGKFPTGTRSLDRNAQLFNTHLHLIATDFERSRKDSPAVEQITVHEFNTSSFFTTLVNDPTTFPQTAGLKNTTGRCEAYGMEWQHEDNDVDLDSWDVECESPLKEYLFWDYLHVTPPADEALADQVGQFLRAVEPRKVEVEDEEEGEGERKELRS